MVEEELWRFLRKLLKFRYSGLVHSRRPPATHATTAGQKYRMMEILRREGPAMGVRHINSRLS